MFGLVKPLKLTGGNTDKVENSPSNDLPLPYAGFVPTAQPRGDLLAMLAQIWWSSSIELSHGA